MNRLILALLLSPTLVVAAPTTQPACPYATAHNAPLNPDETLKDKTDEYTRYLVKFNGIESNTRVPGYLYIPNDTQTTHPAILLQYGSGGSKSTNYIVAMAQIAMKHHFVILTIDIPNKGDRRSKGSLLPNIFDGKFLQTLGDYSRSIDYLASRKEVDVGRICYAGISWGAITGITFYADDERIKVIASMVGGGNFLGWLPGKPADDVLESVKQFDPVYHVALIGTRPLLLLNVKHDQLVPQFLSESLHKAAPPTATKIWLDTDHFFSTVDRPAECDKVIQFIEDHLPR